MTTAFLGSESEHSRQKLRGKAYGHLGRDLYVVGAPPGATSLADLDLTTRVEAAGLVLPDGVLCLTTSGLWQKLPVDDDGLVHLLRSRDKGGSERPGVSVHRIALTEEEVLEVKGVRVTDGPRTLADLAPKLTLEELVAVGDVVRRRYPQAAIEEAVVRAARRPGVALLRRAATLLDPGSDSPAETRARLRLHAAGFTALRHKTTITDDAGGWLATPDLGDPEAKVAVQHEGESHFSKGEDQRIHDVDRDDLSRMSGWQVVISTKLDDRNPAKLVGKVTAAYFAAALRYGRQVLPPHLRA